MHASICSNNGTVLLDLWSNRILTLPFTGLMTLVRLLNPSNPPFPHLSSRKHFLSTVTWVFSIARHDALYTYDLYSSPAPQEVGIIIVFWQVGKMRLGHIASLSKVTQLGSVRAGMDTWSTFRAHSLKLGSVAPPTVLNHGELPRLCPNRLEGAPSFPITAQSAKRKPSPAYFSVAKWQRSFFCFFAFVLSWWHRMILNLQTGKHKSQPPGLQWAAFL